MNKSCEPDKSDGVRAPIAKVKACVPQARSKNPSVSDLVLRTDKPQTPRSRGLAVRRRKRKRIAAARIEVQWNSERASRVILRIRSVSLGS